MSVNPQNLNFRRSYTQKGKYKLKQKAGTSTAFNDRQEEEDISKDDSILSRQSAESHNKKRIKSNLRHSFPEHRFRHSSFEDSLALDEFYSNYCQKIWTKIKKFSNHVIEMIGDGTSNDNNIYKNLLDTARSGNEVFYKSLIRYSKGVTLDQFHDDFFNILSSAENLESFSFYDDFEVEESKEIIIAYFFENLKHLILDGRIELSSMDLKKLIILLNADINPVLGILELWLCELISESELFEDLKLLFTFTRARTPGSEPSPLSPSSPNPKMVLEQLRIYLTDDQYSLISKFHSQGNKKVDSILHDYMNEKISKENCLENIIEFLQNQY